MPLLKPILAGLLAILLQQEILQKNKNLGMLKQNLNDTSVNLTSHEPQIKRH